MTMRKKCCLPRLCAPVLYCRAKRPEVRREMGDIQCRERLGGLLRYYFRQAGWSSV